MPERKRRTSKEKDALMGKRSGKPSETPPEQPPADTPPAKKGSQKPKPAAAVAPPDPGPDDKPPKWYLKFNKAPELAMLAWKHNAGWRHRVALADRQIAFQDTLVKETARLLEVKGKGVSCACSHSTAGPEGLKGKAEQFCFECKHLLRFVFDGTVSHCESLEVKTKGRHTALRDASKPPRDAPWEEGQSAVPRPSPEADDALGAKNAERCREANGLSDDEWAGDKGDPGDPDERDH